MNSSTGVLYAQAVRVYLIGPDQQVLSEYKKSPEGRYLLQLPQINDLRQGRYEFVSW